MLKPGRACGSSAAQQPNMSASMRVCSIPPIIGRASGANSQREWPEQVELFLDAHDHECPRVQESGFR